MIDTHVHFWNADHLSYPAAKAGSPYLEPYHPEDFAAHSAGCGVDGYVFVEVGVTPAQILDEVAWVERVAGGAPAGTPRLRGIVARAPFDAADPGGALDALAADPRAVGVRRGLKSVGVHSQAMEEIVRGVRALAARGLSFDLLVRADELPLAERVAEECPDTRMILDHCGNPEIRDGVSARWRDGVRALAAKPNVACKLSGLTTCADHDHWTTDDLRPAVEHVFESFGADRLLYGGDWPISLRATSYARWVATVDELFGDLSDGDRQKVLRENAIRWYELE